MAFSFLLRHAPNDTIDNEMDTEQIRVFLANSNSNNYFNEPPTITDKDSVDDIFNIITEDDLLENCSLMRDNSQWKFESFLSVCIFAHHLPDFPIGAGDDQLTNADLPDYILKNKNILTLLYDQNNHVAKRYSNLCIFRAIAVHRTKNYISYEREAKALYKQYQNYLKENKKQKKETSIRRFPGVTLKDIIQIEHCFKIDIQIWELSSISKKKKKKSKKRKNQNHEIENFFDNEAMDGNYSEEEMEEEEEGIEIDNEGKINEKRQIENMLDNEENEYFNERFENMKAKVIRHSLKTFGNNTIHLLQYASHFMYVKNHKALAKR